MRLALVLTLAAVLATLPSPAPADDAAASVERGHQVAIVSGCHDCHSAGYMESGGKLDPARALAGAAIGFRGPWGTTYPSNLRLVAAGLDEAGFAEHLKTLQTLPPMPYFNLHAMSETDLRSLYLCIRSLGEPGEPAPAYVPPDEEPTTPFVVFAPPTMPKV